MAVCVALALYLGDGGVDLRGAHRNYHLEENVNLLSFFRDDQRRASRLTTRRDVVDCRALVRKKMRSVVSLEGLEVREEARLKSLSRSIFDRFPQTIDSTIAKPLQIAITSRGGCCSKNTKFKGRLDWSETEKRGVVLSVNGSAVIYQMFPLSLSLSLFLVAVHIFDSGRSRRQLHNRDGVQRAGWGKGQNFPPQSQFAIPFNALGFPFFSAPSLSLPPPAPLALTRYLVAASDRCNGTRRVAPHAIRCTGDDNVLLVASRFATLKESRHAHRSALREGVNFNDDETAVTREVSL